MICKKCNYNLADNAKFCPKCGTKARDSADNQDVTTKKCPRCGTENPLSARFCKIDGYNFQHVQENAVNTQGDIEKPPDSFRVICPRCGTSYGHNVKFCRKDGARLQNVAQTETTDLSDIKSDAPQMSYHETKDITTTEDAGIVKQPIRLDSAGRAGSLTAAEISSSSKKKTIAVAAVILVMLIFAGTGSYLYLTGFLSKNQETVAATINNELKGKGLNLFCEIDKNWTAFLKGTTHNPTDKDVAAEIIRRHKGIKELKDEVTIQFTPNDVTKAIETALQDRGIKDIYAKVDEKLTVTLHGIAGNEAEKEMALKITAELGIAKEVKDNIKIQKTITQPTLPGKPYKEQQFTRQETKSKMDIKRDEEPKQQEIKPHFHTVADDPAKIEGAINKALRDAGLTGITAEVSDDMGVILKGSTMNPADKEKAFAIAKSFKGIKKIRDKIFVVQ